jgi:hypothetical protein
MGHMKSSSDDVINDLNDTLVRVQNRLDQVEKELIAKYAYVEHDPTILGTFDDDEDV